MAEKLYNRWLVVVGALLVQLCLGSIYSWAIFTKPLRDAFGWSQAQAQYPFMVGLAAFALTTIVGGKWQDKAGPRVVAATGGIVLAIGYFLASRTTSLAWIIVTYGIIAGIGIGLGYTCPLAAGVKWFPDKKGLITGLAVAGFGAGSFVFSKVGTAIINGSSWQNAFMILGVIFLIGVIVGALLLRNPPAGYKPVGWNPPVAAAGKPAGRDFTSGEMLGTLSFWLIWLMFAVGATAGLMVIGNVGAIAKVVIPEITAGQIATLTGILALLNGLGRVTWGTVSDRLGRTRTLTVMYIFNAVVMLLLLNANSYMFLMLAICLAGFCFGGNFAVFPSATNDYFGTRNYGNNYGFVFTSYGVGGIVGPLLGAMVFDMTRSYSQAYIISLIMLVIAAVLSLITRSPGTSKA